MAHLDRVLLPAADAVQRGLNHLADALERLARWLRDPPGGAAA